MLQDMKTVTALDRSSPFEVTDLLRGTHYFVEDKGSHYELQFSASEGTVRVPVALEADLTDIADEIYDRLRKDNLDMRSKGSERSCAHRSPYRDEL